MFAFACTITARIYMCVRALRFFFPGKLFSEGKELLISFFFFYIYKLPFTFIEITITPRQV